jgi:hypothetical protein
VLLVTGIGGPPAQDRGRGAASPRDITRDGRPLRAAAFPDQFEDYRCRPTYDSDHHLADHAPVDPRVPPSRGVSSPCVGAFHRTPSSHPRTLGGRSPVDRPRGTIALARGWGRACHALLPSGPAGVGPPAGVLPDRSSGPPFRLFRWLPRAARGLDPGGRGRVVSDRPSLLQGFLPARSHCADARAFVRAKLRHTREKVRGRLPARLVMSRLDATRCGGSGREGCGGSGREGCGGSGREGCGGSGRGRGRALARGQARARQGEEAFR